ncbi:MAG TPA: hypothetical protein VGM88_30070 [Kofleriaceae bacterium]|jgi:hypothetical protein
MADDWSDRQLCDDGACTGVIGPGGTCSVCGKAAVGFVARATDADETADASEDDEDRPEDADEGPEAPDDEPGVAGTVPSDWDNRELCSDGACTGVIADNGKCSVCGKAAA